MQRKTPIKRIVCVSRRVFNRLSARGKELKRQSRSRIAFLELFIAERGVNRMISEQIFQDAVLLACVRRVVSRSGILPDGQAFQDGYDSRWDTYNLFWRDPLDSTAGMALAGQVISLSGASTHYDLLMYLVQRIATSYTQILELLRDYQKEFRLSL